MFRLSASKTHIIPHSLAIISAIVLLLSSQADNSGFDISRQLEPQQTLVAEVCEEATQRTVKAISKSSITFLHLF